MHLREGETRSNPTSTGFWGVNEALVGVSLQVAATQHGVLARLAILVIESGRAECSLVRDDIPVGSAALGVGVS